MIAMKCVNKVYEPPGKYDRTGSWHFQNNCGRPVRVFWCSPQQQCDKDQGSSTNLAKDETTKYETQVVRWGACYGTALDGRGFVKGTQGIRIQCFDD